MATIEQAVVRKVSRRLIPFLIFCYFVAYLDRVNVGFAALTMNRALGFTPVIYAWGAGIFFIGYLLFEVPSNVILERIGARIWIARIMVSWGFISLAMAFVWDTTSFYVARFLLGVAEAGFFPGIILYLTYWFPQRSRPGSSGSSRSRSRSPPSSAHRCRDGFSAPPTGCSVSRAGNGCSSPRRCPPSSAALSPSPS